ncbi:MAG: SUMF1/EgtB/PvdO family nonheme iron enzyme [Pirellulaceae bacterium]
MVSCVESREFCQRITRLLREQQLLPENLEVRCLRKVSGNTAFARAKTTYCFGDDQAALGHHAWFTANAAGNDPPVGAKRANKWGLFDMHGYVWEWCESADGTTVLRGGSWKDPAGRLACSFRRSERKLFATMPLVFDV